MVTQQVRTHGNYIAAGSACQTVSVRPAGPNKEPPDSIAESGGYESDDDY
jgi:hypothetical protein